MRLGPYTLRWPITTRRAAVSAGSIQGSHYTSLLGVTDDIASVVNYSVIDKMLQYIPILDTGHRKFTRYATGFGVKADNDRLQDALDEFLGVKPLGNAVRTSYVQRGFRSFETRHIRSMLQYGRALSEVVLDDSAKGIWGLLPINSGEVRIKRADNGRDMVFGQQGPMDVEPTWFPNQEWFVYNVSNVEGDTVNGRPLLFRCTWVADVILSMERAIKQMWWRHGAPSFLLMAEFDPNAVDPGGDVASEMTNAQGSLKSEWMKNLRDRWETQGIRDFFYAGTFKLNFQAIGADVKELSFEVPYRALMEQVLSTLELPPFMYGLSWSTTERLSAEQADAITKVIEDVRSEVEPDFCYIVEKQQEFLGLRGTWEPTWEEVNLADEVEQAKARQMNAQAGKLERANLLTDWQQGVIAQEQYGEAVGAEQPFPVPREPEEGPTMPTAGGGGGAIPGS